MVMDKEIMRINSIQKPKITKGYGYVLKSSQLNEVLVENGFSVDTSLEYWKPQQLGSIFEAFYWFPNDYIPYTRLFIRAGALGKEDLQQARKEMIATVFPEFVKWLRRIVDEPDNSTILGEKLYFNAVFADGKIEIRI